MFDVLNLREATTEAGRTYHLAELAIDGKTYPVTDRWGSWEVDIDGRRRHLIPTVAADLQAEVGGPARKRR